MVCWFISGASLAKDPSLVVVPMDQWEGMGVPKTFSLKIPNFYSVVIIYKFAMSLLCSLCFQPLQTFGMRSSELSVAV